MSADHPTTEFRLIPNNPGYRINSIGVVQSRLATGGRGTNRLTSNWHTLKPSVCSGYFMVILSYGGKRCNKFIHRLVLETFVGPCPTGQEARHLNDDKSDCRLENLCWGTPKENGEDKVRNGSSMPGEKHPMARLTKQDVLEVRRLLRSGVPQRTVAHQFHVSRGCIQGIHNGRNWKTLP